MAESWIEIATKIMYLRPPFGWLELAVETMIDLPRMTRLQYGKEEPTLNEARRIARCLGCRLDDLWGDRPGEIASRSDPGAAMPLGIIRMGVEGPKSPNSESLALQLVGQIALEIGPLMALSNLIATHRYHAQENPAPCSNTSASPAASTAPPSASPAST